MKKFYKLICLICFSFNSVNGQVTPPYYNDFETDTIGWYAISNSGSVWQWDTVNSGACSGAKAWGIGLDSIYLPNTSAFLYTPEFDFTSIATATLCFWHKYQTELYQDGTRMEYSIDNGITWIVLGSAGIGPQWYNCFFIIAGGNFPGWSGFAPACQYASISLDSLGGNATVQFRFVFSSDVNVNNYEGHIIDEFAVCVGSCNCNSSVGIYESYNSKYLFDVYPNPANDFITISLKSKLSGNITLSNLLGKEIYYREVLREETRIDVKNIPAGIYFVSIQKEEIINRKKIVIIH